MLQYLNNKCFFILIGLSNWIVCCALTWEWVNVILSSYYIALYLMDVRPAQLFDALLLDCSIDKLYCLWYLGGSTPFHTVYHPSTSFSPWACDIHVYFAWWPAYVCLCVQPSELFCLYSPGCPNCSYLTKDFLNFKVNLIEQFWMPFPKQHFSVV